MHLDGDNDYSRHLETLKHKNSVSVFNGEVLRSCDPYECKTCKVSLSQYSALTNLKAKIQLDNVNGINEDITDDNTISKDNTISEDEIIIKDNNNNIAIITIDITEDNNITKFITEDKTITEDTTTSYCKICKSRHNNESTHYKCTQLEETTKKQTSR